MAQPRLSIVGERHSTRGTLHEYDGTFLDCRDLRHSWQRQGYWIQNRRVYRRLTCERCETERIDVWSKDGLRFSSRYEYTDGYLVPGHGAIAPRDIRHEIIDRATVFDTEDQMIEAFTRRTRRKAATR